MRGKVFVVVASIVGSFAVYCAQTATNGLGSGDGSPTGGGDGRAGWPRAGDGGLLDAALTLFDSVPGVDSHFVKDAAAAAGGECCTAKAPQFVKLEEKQLNNKGQTGNVLAVGSYQEVVVYVTATGSECMYTQKWLFPEFRADGQTPFGRTGQAIGESGGRVRVDGPDMRLRFDKDDGYPGCSMSYVIAAVVEQ